MAARGGPGPGDVAEDDAVNGPISPGTGRKRIHGLFRTLADQRGAALTTDEWAIIAYQRPGNLQGPAQARERHPRPLEAWAVLAEVSGDAAGATSLRANAESLFGDPRAVEWGREIRPWLVWRAYPIAGDRGGPT